MTRFPLDSAELYPTVVRAAGMSISMGFSRIGSISAPYIGFAVSLRYDVYNVCVMYNFKFSIVRLLEDHSLCANVHNTKKPCLTLCDLLSFWVSKMAILPPPQLTPNEPRRHGTSTYL